MEKRRIGEHGRKGETRALIILELLKASLEGVRKDVLSNDGERKFVQPLRVVRTGFVPVRRSDLKWNLKAHGISPKNADALIRVLEKDKALKVKPSGINLNNLTMEGLVSIMEFLTGSPYYMPPPKGTADPFVIKKDPSGERPLSDALNRAFVECFICAYGDMPFSPYVDPEGKWNGEVIRYVLGKNKRPGFISGQVNEIMDIARIIRGELTVKFKLLYVWRVSMMIANGWNDEFGRKCKFSSISMSELPRAFIEGPDKINATDDETYITFAMGHFFRFMLMADNPNVSYLDSEVSKNEGDILTLKTLLVYERTLSLESLFANHGGLKQKDL